MLHVYESVAPLRQSITQEDVADMALFLGSNLSRNVRVKPLCRRWLSTLAMAELERR